MEKDNFFKLDRGIQLPLTNLSTLFSLHGVVSTFFDDFDVMYLFTIAVCHFGAYVITICKLRDLNGESC